MIIEDDGTFLGNMFIASYDGFIELIRDQEYSEGKLLSGINARDDGFARMRLRFDKEQSTDLISRCGRVCHKKS